MVEEMENPNATKETNENKEASETSETYRKVIQRDLNRIQTEEPKEIVDVSIYEGKRFKIAKVEEVEVINFYNGPVINDKPSYNPNSTEKKHVIEIETEPLPKIGKDGEVLPELVTFGEGKFLSVKAKFNLKLNDSNNWVVSKHSRASLWKFMRKMSVENLEALIGKFVTLTTEGASNPDDDRIFLKIVH